MLILDLEIKRKFMCSTGIQLKDYQTNFLRKMVIFINEGLDNETKIKLKVLIQNHMSKLLMRIEEENHSLISESSTKQFIF